MPQDGSSNYQYPPGTPGVPDQTIESEAYNTFLDDLVVNDLNIPRPIHRGGTGASTTSEALVNLTGEKATQLVTNYDAHVWVPGSFRSSNATGQGAPIDGHAFAGICYINEPLVFPPTNQNVIVEARDENDTTAVGRVYVREKKTGVWGAWFEQVGSVASIPAVKTANYAIVVTDHNAIIRGTGSWTLSHTVTAAGNAGFRYTIKNDGLATITIDPAGAETIDGTATRLCLAKQQFDVVSDGTNWFTVGRQNAVSIIQTTLSAVASAQFTMPPDYNTFEVEITAWTNSLASTMALRFATDEPPNFISSANYYYQANYNSAGSTLAASALLAVTNFTLTRTQFAGASSGIVKAVIAPQNCSYVCMSSVLIDGSGTRYVEVNGGYMNLNGRSTYILLYPASGGTISGTFTLMGKTS